MSLEVKQTARSQGNERWRWAVWLDGPDEELDEVEAVEYTLHPTFPNPVRSVTNRSTNFRLDGSGWGEFMIYLLIMRRGSDEPERREHWLRFGSRETTSRTGPTQERPKLFLSYGLGDVPFAQALTETLNEHGIEVVTSADQHPDLPWEVSLNELLAGAGHAVFLVSSPSNWTVLEAEAARKHRIPMSVVALGDQPEIPPSLSSVTGITAKAMPDDAETARALADDLAKAM